MPATAEVVVAYRRAFVVLASTRDQSTLVTTTVRRNWAVLGALSALRRSARDGLPRHVFVDAHIARQTEHTLTEDVAHDL